MASVKQTARKTVKYLREKGLWETGKKAIRHFGRKSDERHFVRAMALTPEEMARQREEKFSRPLKFSVAVPLYNTPLDLLRETIDSVCDQTYQDWELCLADGSDEAHGAVGDYCRERAKQEPRIRYEKLERNGGISENTNACLAMATGDYIALFDHDDLLTPNALYEMRSAIEKTGADFLYSDEMIFQSPRRNKIIGIKVKPGFSPDTLLTNNYICHLSVFSRELWEAVGGFRKQFDGSQDHDMILRLTNRAKGIAHISKVLYLWRAIPASTAADIGSKTYAIDAGRSAVKTFLREQRGIDAEVESTEVFPTMYRVRYPIEGNPAVRVVLNTSREKEPIEGKLRVLKESAGWENCVWMTDNGILASSSKSRHPAFEMGVISGKGQPIVASETALGSKRCPSSGAVSEQGEWSEGGKSCSRSLLWNQAVEAASEDYLLFIDGVPEPMSEGWLREMLSWAQLSHVGAVGAKLHFRRGTVRHAGVVIGMGPGGAAGRPYYVEMQDREGYFGHIAVVGDVSAVTDMLLVSREKFRQAGGFCEEYRDSLFDVDLCLRLQEMGHYNIFTPHARLKMGSAKEIFFDVGREYDSWAADAEVFRKRNAKILKNGDPYFNPNLSPKYEDWRLKRVD